MTRLERVAVRGLIAARRRQSGPRAAEALAVQLAAGALDPATLAAERQIRDDVSRLLLRVRRPELARALDQA